MKERLKISSPGIKICFSLDGETLSADVRRPAKSLMPQDFLDLQPDALRAIAENAAAVLEWLGPEAAEAPPAPPDRSWDARECLCLPCRACWARALKKENRKTLGDGWVRCQNCGERYEVEW